MHAPAVSVHEPSVFGSWAACWRYCLEGVLQVHRAVQLELSLAPAMLQL